ncbi:hypothetical protein CC86DRAFT_385781 [Ophiobolus disseminans]|uniref:Protein kinase domain-containing protein n=1 Tax=Ophiobolus disseminans TaxID=1469910 RepID=A0A6A6ZMR6_9PLEO|nr:hypothetical protein CC86DRAFT_385781 [Ophiobolus disseminans]
MAATYVLCSYPSTSTFPLVCIHKMDRHSDSDGESVDFGRINSMLRRTTTRHATTELDELHNSGYIQRVPDFLDIISHISTLYRKNALPMEPFDHLKTTRLDSGAIFHVSSWKTEYASASPMTRSTVRRRKRVVLKKLPVLVFDPNGKPFDNLDSRDAAESLLRELRVLTSSAVQKHPNIVKLLAIAWGYEPCPDACPSIGLVLEFADCNLDKFLRDHHNLKFSSKKRIACDLASGLSALHNYGIVHGDLKPENILMFKSRNDDWAAKLADFSHSMFDTGEKEDRCLPGGTWLYAAPEWEQKAPIQVLMKSDIYSFGIVASCVIIGYDIMVKYLKECESESDGRKMRVQTLKETGEMMNYVLTNLHALDETDLGFTTEDLSTAEKWLRHTLHLHPERRSLSSLTQGGSERSGGTEVTATFVPHEFDSSFLEIPYQALEPTSNVLKKCIVSSLREVAQNDSYSDPSSRGVAAAFELCICLASGFGEDRDTDEAIKWLIQAARSGESTAQSMCYQLFTALGREPSLMVEEIDNWLVQAAKKGSWTAVKSLKALNSNNYQESFDWFRTTTSPYSSTTANDLDQLTSNFSSKVRPTYPPFYISGWGERDQTFLHWAAMHGLSDVFTHLSSTNLLTPEELSIQDKEGDTPLIYACRAARDDIVVQLVEAGARPGIANYTGENVLHFLHTFDDTEIDSVVELLVEHGADISQESKISSAKLPIFDNRMSVPGCPILRAVTMNNMVLVRALLHAKIRFQSPQGNREQMLWRASCFKLLAWACRLNHGPMIEIIYKANQDVYDASQVQSKTFWMMDEAFSIPALAVTGCVSSNPSYGQDFPERMWRYMYHGKDHSDHLRQTFDALQAFGFNIATANCGPFRNALFMATSIGRTDIVSLLLADENTFHPMEPFGPVTLVQNSSTRAFPFWPPPDCPNHSHKFGLVEAVVLAIESGKHDIYEILLGTRDAEALKMGPVYPVCHIWPGLATRRELGSMVASNVSHLFPSSIATVSKPHWGHVIPRTGGRGHSNSDDDSDDDDHRLGRDDEDGKYRPGSVYTMNSSHDWPESKLCKFGEIFSDGRLNYSLLYMSIAISSRHRDMEFAHTLLDRLRFRPDTFFYNWAPRSSLEHCSFQEIILPYPVILAAHSRWPAMLRLLLANGASTDTKAYESPKKIEIQDTDHEFHPDLLHRLRWRRLRARFRVRTSKRLWTPVILETTVFWHLFGLIQDRKASTSETRPGNWTINPEGTLKMIIEQGDEKALHPSSRSMALVNFRPDTLYDRLQKMEVHTRDLQRTIWGAIVKQRSSQVGSTCRRDTPVGFVFSAALNNDPVALESLLDMGYSPNGRWWNFLLFTPLDATTVIRVKKSTTQSQLDDRRTCQQLLVVRHGTRGGIGFTAEAHVFLSTLYWLSVIVSTILSIWFCRWGISKWIQWFDKFFETSCKISHNKSKDTTWNFIIGMILLIFVVFFLLMWPILAAILFFIAIGIPVALNMWAAEQGFFKDSMALTFLLPSLLPIIAFIHNGSIVLCARSLHGPTAGFLRRVVDASRREPRSRHLVDSEDGSSDEEDITSDDEETTSDDEDITSESRLMMDEDTALQHPNSRFSRRRRFGWPPVRLGRMTWRSLKAGDAYTDDEAHDPGMELSSQFFRQQRRDPGSGEETIREV